MKTVFALLPLFVATNVAFGAFFSPIVHPIDEIGYGIGSLFGKQYARDLAVEVPTIGKCPLYVDSHGAAEQRKLFEMGQLAADSYKDGTAAPPDGYTPVTDQATLDKYLGPNSGFSISKDGKGTITKDGVFGKTSGFQAALYIGPGGSLVLAFRGTENPLTSPADVWTDIAQALEISKPNQYEYASELLGKLLKGTEAQGMHIDVAGHSLGGGETQYALATNDLNGRVSGYTFNSAGLSNHTLNSMDYEHAKAAAEALTNVRNRGDSVSAGTGGHLGGIYDYENPSFKAHGIGDLVGRDKDGKPIYNGLLGNIQRDLAKAEGKKPPDYLSMDDNELMNAAAKANAAASAALSKSSSDSSAGGSACQCDGSVAKRKEYEDLLAKQKNARDIFFQRKNQKEGAMWKLVADVCKPLPGIAKKIADGYFGEWAGRAVNVFNEAFEEYLNDKLDMTGLVKKIIRELQDGLKDEIKEELKEAAKDTGGKWYDWILHPIDSITAFVDKWTDILESAWDFSTTIGGDIANIVASRGYYRDAKERLANLTRQLEEAREELEANGGCYCGDGCECPHCKKEKGQKDDNPPDGTNPSTGGDTNPGTGGGTTPSTGEEPSPTPGGGASRFIHDPGNETENPWDRIFGGITGNGKADSGGSSLLDIVGMGDFSKMLDSLSDVADIAGSLSTVSQLAGGIWGAASGIGTERIQELEDFIAFNVNQIVNSFVAKVSGKIGDWVSGRLSSISDLIEKYTGPANEWLDKMGGKIDKWLKLGLDVSKSIDAMTAYVESLNYTRVSAPRLTVVDYGIDAEIKVDTTGNSQRKRTIHQRYSEDVK